jgi:hypothetical protein
MMTDVYAFAFRFDNNLEAVITPESYYANEELINNNATSMAVFKAYDSRVDGYLDPSEVFIRPSSVFFIQPLSKEDFEDWFD